MTTAPVEPATSLVGYIDRVDCAKIIGWAFDPRRPNDPILIEADVSNGTNLVTVADIYRADVKAAGHGNGNHGFEFDFNGVDVKSETVIVRFFDTKQSLRDEPIDFDPERHFLANPMPPAYGEMILRLAAEIQQKHIAQAKADGRV